MKYNKRQQHQQINNTGAHKLYYCLFRYLTLITVLTWKGVAIGKHFFFHPNRFVAHLIFQHVLVELYIITSIVLNDRGIEYICINCTSSEITSCRQNEIECLRLHTVQQKVRRKIVRNQCGQCNNNGKQERSKQFCETRKIKEKEKNEIEKRKKEKEKRKKKKKRKKVT